MVFKIQFGEHKTFSCTSYEWSGSSFQIIPDARWCFPSVLGIPADLGLLCDSSGSGSRAQVSDILLKNRD